MTVSRMISIHSVDNAQFKHLKKIATSARHRRAAGQTLLDGVHLLMALAEAQGTLQMLIVRTGADHLPEIAQCMACFETTPVIMLSPALFDVLSPVETAVGVLGLMPIPVPVNQTPQCAVLLDSIQDPGNVGSILRTAAAAGWEAVYLSHGCAEAWSPKALRAGMGAQFNIAVYEHQDLVLAAQSFKRVFVTGVQAQQSIYDLDLTGSVAFVFGNEGAGVSAELSQQATQQVAIPMPGRMESLNVAAAAAICLYERVRQVSMR